MIHLWRIKLNASEEINKKCQSVLGEREIARLDSFPFDREKKSYLISQGILRMLLGAYTCKNPQDVQMGRHSRGKPYSADDRKLFFNMSNSGDYCVFAFCRVGEVGIDLEMTRELSDLEQLIRTNFTESEQRFINAIPAERMRRFFLFWTIKESYLKATGEGMSIAPHNLEFDASGKGIRLLSVNGVEDFEDWCFDECSFPGYVRMLTHKVDTALAIRDLELV